MMNDAYACARRILTAAALTLVAPAALARPVLVAPQQLAVPQLVEPQFPGQYATGYGQPAIDGDTLLVEASRFINTNGDRRSGVFLFERGSNGTWNYLRPLIEDAGGGIVLNGNLAVVHTFAALLVFERAAQGWMQTDSLETETGEWHSADTVFRIDAGSLYVRRDDWVFPPRECQPPFREWRKVNGSWIAVAIIGGERCGDHRVDVNDGRALLVDRPTDPAQLQGPAFIHAQAAVSWPRVAELAPPPPDPRGYVNWFGYSASLSGNSAYIDSGWLFRNNGGNAWVSAGRLREPETELGIGSHDGKLRGNTLVVYGNEADYEFRTLDWELPYNWRTLRAYRKLANGSFDYYARMNPDYDVWTWSLSEDGRRIAATGPDNNNEWGEATRLYVFEIPDAVTFNGTQQDTFETGNLARWTTSGNPLTIATNGASRVMRQSSLSGGVEAHLAAIDWADQSIEADIRPYQFADADSWVGLETRRTESGDRYYLKLSPPNIVTLNRRALGGVDNLIARADLRTPFVPGRSYRVRLESVGAQHAVFIDGMPRLRVRDYTIPSGHPGIHSARTRFDVDNVVVSNAARLAARLDTWERLWSGEYYWLTTGSWRFANQSGGDVNGDGESDIYALQQTDTSGDVKWFSKIALGNHVVSARVRPVRYGATTATQDAWVGLAAQVKDERNYYYITLRDSNRLSLRRMVNGTVQELASVPQPVTTGAWYDLRLEIVNTSIRVHVNGTLKIQMNDSTLSGGGRNGMLMYKAAADWLSYVAYQP
jgi:hypothetical protein